MTTPEDMEQIMALLAGHNPFELYRQLLTDRPVGFRPGLARRVGGATAGLFLSQLLYWSEGRGDDPDGWIYKTQAEWSKETALTRREQETGRKYLKAIGVVEEYYSRLDHRQFYRVVWPALIALLISSPHSPMSETDIRESTAPGVSEETEYGADPYIPESPKAPFGSGVKRHSGMAESAIGEPQKRHSFNEQRLHTESTSESTSERTPRLPPAGVSRGVRGARARKNASNGTKDEVIPVNRAELHAKYDSQPQLGGHAGVEKRIAKALNHVGKNVVSLHVHCDQWLQDDVDLGNPSTLARGRAGPASLSDTEARNAMHRKEYEEERDRRLLAQAERLEA